MPAFTFDSPMPSGTGNTTVPRLGTMGQQGQQGVPVTRYPIVWALATSLGIYDGPRYPAWVSMTQT